MYCTLFSFLSDFPLPRLVTGSRELFRGPRLRRRTEAEEAAAVFLFSSGRFWVSLAWEESNLVSVFPVSSSTTTTTMGVYTKGSTASTVYYSLYSVLVFIIIVVGKQGEDKVVKVLVLLLVDKEGLVRVHQDYEHWNQKEDWKTRETV